MPFQMTDAQLRKEIAENSTNEKNNKIKAKNNKIKSDREYFTHENRLRPFVGATFSMAASFCTIGRLTRVAPHVAGWPFYLSSLAAYPITYAPWMFLNTGLRELMCRVHPFLRTGSLLLLDASMMYLTCFIGLAIATSFLTIAFNPFTLPCLIGVAIAGAIAVTTAIAVASRMRYIPQEDKGLILSTCKKVLNPFSERPLDHHQENVFVLPFGYDTESDRLNERLDKSKGLFGGLFSKSQPTTPDHDPDVTYEDVYVVNNPVYNPGRSRV